MTTTAARLTPTALQERAQRHLWMHFTRLGDYTSSELPIIVRGEGCYVYDQHGKRYLDGLSGLFCVNIGHGRGDVAQAGADQAHELGYYPIWSHAHPPAIALAERLATLAPGDLNRVFFTSGGSESVESAFKLARQFHKLDGAPLKTKLIARETAYHGTSMGALTATGIPDCRLPFEPLVAGGSHVPNTNTYRLPAGTDVSYFTEALRERILFEGPDTVAAVIMEPVQNSGGSFVPPPDYFPRVREICDEFGVLLIADEVITAFGRIGEWFASSRYDLAPDMITLAKGITSAYAPMGAVLVHDRLVEPFLATGQSFMHGFTFAAGPVAAAIAMANLDVLEGERVIDNVRARESEFRSVVETLLDIPIVGEVRGAGYFLSIELVKDQDTKETFTDEESDWLLRGFLSGQLYDRGLICRNDDRGDPVVQLAPPLIAGPEEFEFIRATLRPVLEEAARLLQQR